MRVTTRAWRWAAPLAAVALIATACGGGGGSSSAAGPAPDTGSADINEMPVDQLQQGGDFRWAITSIPPNFNYNQVDGTLKDNSDVVFALMPRPYRFSADGTPTVNTDYFSSIELTSDSPQVVTYTINPDATWSDGSPITWEDLQAQWQALNGTNTEYQISSSTGYEDISDVTQGTDAKQAVVTFAQPFGDWQSLFDPLYPKTLNRDPDAFNTGLATDPGVTAGPFRFGGLDQTAKRISLVPNPDWWGEKPVLNSIVYLALDPDTFAQALANNEIDYGDIGSSVSQNQTARSTAGVTVRQAQGPDYRHMTFNGAEGSILSDPALRVAVMKGINRDGIAQALLNGIVQTPTTLGNHIYVDGLNGYQDNSQVASFDPTAAGQMLDDLGWVRTGDTRAKDGRQLVIRDVIPAGVQTSAQEAQIAQQNLAQIGVTLNIETVPSQGFFKDYVNTGNFDVTHFAWLGTPFPVSSSGSIYALNEDLQQNYGRIGNQKINDLFAEAKQELDPQRKIDLANQIDTEIWAEGFSLLLYQRPQNHAVRSTLANFGSEGFGTVDYTKIGFTG